MPTPLFVLIVGLELLVAVTILAPAILPGRFGNRPQLGILTWLLGFTVGFISAVIAASAVIWIAVAEYLNLFNTSIAETNIPQVLAASFAPWLLVATAGVTLVLANSRLQNQSESLSEMRTELANTAERVSWQRVSVLVLPLQVPLAGVLHRNILISKSVDELPPQIREAVLWHELAHIRLGHGQVRNLARVVTRLMPGVLAARTMRAELDRLTEIAADNWAAKRCDRHHLATAREQFQEFLPTSVR